MGRVAEWMAARTGEWDVQCVGRAFRRLDKRADIQRGMTARAGELGVRFMDGTCDQVNG